jgi:putative transposase
MEYSHRYRAYPDDAIVTTLLHHIDIHRQAYNYTRYEYENINSENIGSSYKHHDRLTDWKAEYPVFAEVNAKALQRTVTRFYQNLTALKELKNNGRKVGRLKWKSPTEYTSMTYNQHGFKLKNTSGRTATVWLSKIGDIPIRYHREIPDAARIKEVTIKQESTGEWFVSFALEVNDEQMPEKPALDTLDTSNSVGVDLGILNYIHTSDGLTVGWLDLSEEYERLAREQRSLSRKDEGSNNWEAQRKRVARVKRRIRRQVLDFQHKLTTWLVTEYDAVFVENLNVRGMLEQSGNARNKQDAAWRQFISLLEYKAKLHGCHVVQVEAAGTTKECAACGVETPKPIWVREHSCPACGFETTRDANASYNIFTRGFEELGLGPSEVTPVETALPTDTDDFREVSAKRVVEAGTSFREAGSLGA